MTDRKYLPTFAELCDRLSIVTLKMIFIPEHRAAYEEERMLIEHDIDQFLEAGQITDSEASVLAPDSRRLSALDIRAIMLVMLSNREIWSNETLARAGKGEGNLRWSHALNGVRNTAKNVLARNFGERVDHKVDCIASDLPGNWDVF